MNAPGGVGPALRRGGKGRIRAGIRELLRSLWVVPRLPLARAGWCAEPAFVIAGAQRAGTTSLFRYLAAHPDVTPPRLKEIHFFDLHWRRGLAWYRAHFPLDLGGEGIFTGEASPYYLFHPRAPERLAATLPRARMLVLLRNPVDRTLSHYHWEVRYGNERRSLREAIGGEERILEAETRRLQADPDYTSPLHRRASYLSRGRYAEQLERWYQWLPRDRILVLKAEDFFGDTRREFARVLDFLDLSPVGRETTFETHNPGRHQRETDVPREELADYFRPHNKALAELVEFDVEDWNEVEP